MKNNEKEPTNIQAETLSIGMNANQKVCIISTLELQGIKAQSVLAIIYDIPHGTKAEATAKRIVDCVNAMEGIDDPAGFVLAHKAAIDLIKKEGNDFMKLAKLILKVKEDKRILLEALNGMKKLHLEQYEEGTIGNQCYKQMNEAIETASKKMSKEQFKS